MSIKIRGRRPHRKQIMSIKGKTRQDPRYKPMFFVDNKKNSSGKKKTRSLRG